jgi:hypothetical protein
MLVRSICVRHAKVWERSTITGVVSASNAINAMVWVFVSGNILWGGRDEAEVVDI